MQPQFRATSSWCSAASNFGVQWLDVRGKENWGPNTTWRLILGFVATYTHAYRPTSSLPNWPSRGYPNYKSGYKPSYKQLLSLRSLQVSTMTRHSRALIMRVECVLVHFLFLVPVFFGGVASAG